jgi:hypothetical protein
MIYRHYCVGGTCGVFLQGTFPGPVLKMGAAIYIASHPKKSFMFENFALLGCYAVYSFIYSLVFSP